MRFRFFPRNFFGQTTFITAVYYTNPKPEIQTDIIEIQITGLNITIKFFFLLFSGKLICSQLTDLVINSRLPRLL